MYDIERYLNIRSAHGSSVSVDGTVAFLMNTTGTPQIWTLENQGQWPEQRTFFDDRVTFVEWSPVRSEFIFGMDEGGNERVKLYRLNDDGHIHELTPVDAKHRWGGWSHDGDTFAYASNRREESVFDVYVQGRTADPTSPIEIYRGDGWISVAGWDPDDNRLLLHQAHSSFDHDVYVLDIETGDSRHLTPHHGDTRYSSLCWGPDGTAVYLVTDQDEDTMYLARIDLESEQLTCIESGGEWNVDGIALDEETGRFVYSRNVDGYTELTVGELTGPDSFRTFPEPTLPAGTAGGVSFNTNATKFSVTSSTDTQNPNIYVVDIEQGKATKWTQAATAGIPAESFISSELIHYETFDDRDIPAYFSVPSRNRAMDSDTGVPVVIDIHGGPESQRRPSFSSIKQYLLGNGYAVFEPNIRGSTGYGRAYTHLDDVERRMDSVADIAAAGEWLANHSAVDEQRLILKGGSYGGFMVLSAMANYPDMWAAGIDIVGIANFVTFLENTGSWRRSLREAEYGSLDTDREFLESISPSNQADAINAPLFILHGENDPRVPADEARQIAAEVGEHVPVKLLIFDDEGHGITKLDNRITAYTEIVAFLNEHV